jgi:hypothetical protein
MEKGRFRFHPPNRGWGLSATWEDLRLYLNKLQEAGDDRLQDNLVAYDPSDGEYYPSEYVEFNGKEDDILDDGHIFIMLDK